MKLPVYDIKGKSLEAWTVSDKELGEINNPLLAQALRIYQANSHQGTSKVKTRGEVVGSTRKIYRQKGTGNARHGARYAPIFVGGGVAHGPKGNRAGNLVLPKKMRRAALRTALLVKLKAEVFAGLTGVDKLDGKTSSVTTLFSKVAGHPKNKTLLIVDEKSANLYRSVSNLQGITLKSVGLVNAFDLISADFVVTTKGALDSMIARATNKLIKPTSTK